METFLGRYRNTSILVAVLFAQVLALAVQVKRPSESGSTRLIRVWVVNAVTPLEKGLVSSGHGVRGLWGDYLYLRGVRRENRELRQEIERMRIEQVRLNEDAVQAHRLQALFNFKEQFIASTVAAQVIGTSGSDLSRVFFIDKGSKDGVKIDMAVITPDGIVGKVLRVFGSSAQVLEISDASSGVGAILEKSRLQGILQGSASGDVVMRYVMSDEKVEPGERVLTSGGDRIFPKGLPIGTVLETNPGRDLFLNIRVKPSANLSRVEEVLVITHIEEKEPVAPEPAAPVRAADILAERLPSVQKKPDAETKSTAAETKPAAGAAQSAASVVKPATTAAATAAPTASSTVTASTTQKPAAAQPAAAQQSTTAPLQTTNVTSAGPTATTAATTKTVAPKQPDRFSPPVVRTVSGTKPEQSSTGTNPPAAGKPRPANTGATQKSAAAPDAAAPKPAAQPATDTSTGDITR